MVRKRALCRSTRSETGRKQARRGDEAQNIREMWQSPRRMKGVRSRHLGEETSGHAELQWRGSRCNGERKKKVGGGEQMDARGGGSRGKSGWSTDGRDNGE